MNQELKMPAGSIENNSKGNLSFFDINVYSHKNVCPFTLETVRDCKTRNLILDKDLCFFMLETYLFSRQDKFKKIVCRK
jgi:hypothetical protein